MPLTSKLLLPATSVYIHGFHPKVVSYLGREPVPFSPEVSLLKSLWPCIPHPTPVFAFLTPPEPPVPPLSLPRVCASPSPRPGTWPSQAGGVVTGEPPSVWMAVRTQSTACAILGEGCLQFERQNKSSHLGNPVPGFFFWAAEPGVGAWV